MATVRNRACGGGWIGRLQAPQAARATERVGAARSGTTAFAAELPAGQPGPAAVARYVRAVFAAADSG